MGLTRFAINRPIAIIMVVVAAVLLGFVSYRQLPAELQPKVDFGVVTISTTYTGTNPEEMETLITKPIEDSISGVSGLRQITSTSQQGISVISCQLYIGTNMESAAADIREKVDAIRQTLPRDADSPRVLKLDTGSQPVMYLAMRGNRSSRELRILADNIIVERLEQAPDVAAVNVSGGDQRELRVSVDRGRLAAYGITIAQLAQSIQSANENLSAGYIQKDNTYASVRFLGELTSVNELRDLRIPLPVASTSSSSTSGPAVRMIRLSDLAQVSDTTVERTISNSIDGVDTVILTIQKTSDGNTLNACNGIRDQLQKLTTILPADVHFITTQDFSKQVHDALTDVVWALLLGALLAVLIVFLFLHNLRATIIIGIAIPTCIMATFVPIAALGFTLNSMTMMGLSLAIGILIDDSIVVIENIFRHLRNGEEPVTAALTGRTEIGLAAIILTMVDLVVFVPIANMGGIVGEFFRSFAVSIAFAVSVSLFVSFTLTPMLASRWFRKGEALETTGVGRRGFFAAFDRGYTGFENGYRRFLSVCLRHPWIVVIIGNAVLWFVLIFVVGGGRLGARFAPGQDQNLVAVSVEAPAGSSLSYTKRISDEIQRRIWADPPLKKEVRYLLASVGQSQTSGFGAGFTGTQYANIQVSLFEKAAILDQLHLTNRGAGAEPLRYESDANIAAHIRDLIKDIPGATLQASEVNGFAAGGAPLEIDVKGMDFDVLLKAANAIKKVVSSAPGTYNADLSFKASQPEVQIRLDRDKAAALGLTLDEVATAVSDATQGDVTAKFRDPKDNQQYDIRVQLADSDRNNIYTIGDVPVAYQNGSPVRLGDVANITLGAGPTRVDRLDRERKIAVTSYLVPGTQIINVQSKIDPILKAMQARGELGQVTYTWGGEAQSFGEELGYLVTAVLLGIALAYMLMSALFNNAVYPLTIMCTLPQALVGGILALWLSGTPFSLIAAIGFILLNGVAAKNAILMVDYTNTLRARGYKRFDALLVAAPTRLRPILMTSLAIIGATLPTAIGLGRGSGFRQPLGVVVVGGVLVSTILTLIVIPSTYVLFDTFSSWWLSRKKHVFRSVTGDGPGGDMNGLRNGSAAGHGGGERLDESDDYTIAGGKR